MTLHSEASDVSSNSLSLGTDDRCQKTAWQFVSVNPTTESSRGSHRKKAQRNPRVARACARCRKQKLRCDHDRPCALCLRSDVPCIDAIAPGKALTRRASKRTPVSLDVAAARAVDSSITESSRPCRRPIPLSPEDHPTHQINHNTSPFTSQSARNPFSEDPISRKRHERDLNDDASPPRPPHALSPNTTPAQGRCVATPEESIVDEPSDDELRSNRWNWTTGPSWDEGNNIPDEIVSDHESMACTTDEHVDLSIPEEEYSGASSTLNLSQLIMASDHPGRYEELTRKGSLIFPGALRNQSEESTKQTRMVHFPPPAIASCLVESYFESSSWFIYLFHEAHVRRRAARIISQAPEIPVADYTFAILLKIIMAYGALYVNPDTWNQIEDFDLEAGPDPNQYMSILLDGLIAAVRDNLLEIVEIGDLEAVQTCFLLASCYMYHGSPRLGWNVAGIGIRLGQAMGLHKQSKWRKSNPVAREVRKRTWMALYVTDRFMGIEYGRPFMVRDVDCDVDELIPVDGLPIYYFTSSSGCLESISTENYFSRKLILYKIAGNIILKVYNNEEGASRNTTLPSQVEPVQELNAELEAWHRANPEVLNDASGVMIDQIQAPDSFKKTLKRQAMALQVAYDNALILLHRPLLGFRLAPQLRPRTPVPSSSDPFDTSLNICLHAALRLAELGSLSTNLKDMRDTHVASFIGLHLLTAAVVLCIVVASDPMAIVAYRAKVGIGKIIQMQRLFDGVTPFARESLNIIKRLVQRVLEKEFTQLYTGDDTESGADHHKKSIPKRSPATNMSNNTGSERSRLNEKLNSSEDFVMAAQRLDVSESPHDLRVIEDASFQEIIAVFGQGNGALPADVAWSNDNDNCQFENLDFSQAWIWSEAAFSSIA